MSILLKYSKDELTEDVKKKLIEDLKIEIVEKGVVKSTFYAIGDVKYKEKKKRYEVVVPFFYGKREALKQTTGITPVISLPLTFPLREHQKEIVKDALRDLSAYSCTTIEIPPGQGKTVIGVYLSESINPHASSKTLIIYPSKIASLADQWKTTLLKFEGIKTENIYVVEDGVEKEKKKILKAMKQKILGGSRSEPTVVRSTTGSSIDYIESFFKDETKRYVIVGDTRVSLFEECKKLFKVLIIDEAHMLCTEKKLKSVFFNLRPKKIITLTATIERVDGLHSLLHLISGPHTIKRLPSLPFEVRIETVKDLKEGEIKLKFNKLTKKMDFTQYCKDLSDNETYNKAVIKTVKKSLEEDRKVIILTKFVEHSVFLKETIEEKLKVKVAILCGSNKNHCDQQVLVGTIPKLSTGYDMATAALNYSGVAPDTLLLIHPIKQYQLFEQCKGRVMRTTVKKPVIYCFKIPGLSFSTKHIEDLREYILGSGGVIV